MAQNPDHVSMALFCDFENVALGVRDANYDKFDIKRVLEKLLLKGSIVVKKAYCDWERYKGFKATMHEANFELIEIPHVRQSGKNSADIRLVVDALDLCYTKSHVNTFVIISGDSDFSPLVSKLRENAKYVIGVGVKNSTSDLLIANCDEFIFYDDLVRDNQRRQQARGNEGHDGRDTNNNANREPQQRRSPEEERKRKDEMAKRRAKAIDIAYETFDALISERGDGGKMWASVLKEAIKRRNPGFNENYFGFRTFGNLLEEAQAKGLIAFGRDEKSGAYVYRPSAEAQAQAQAQSHASQAAQSSADVSTDVDGLAIDTTPADAPAAEPRRGRRPPSRRAQAEAAPSLAPAPVEPEHTPEPAAVEVAEPLSEAPRRSRSGGRSGGRTAVANATANAPAPAPAAAATEAPAKADAGSARQGRGRSRGGKSAAATAAGADEVRGTVAEAPVAAPDAAAPATSAGRPRQRRSSATGTRRKSEA
jgi:uncharacterized LabA/DUF88 family protein